jgi:hypothetical protein
MLTLTGDRLELQTPYAGKITIPRKMLKFVAPARVSAAPVFEGPTGMQGWKSTGDPVWQFRNETLVTRAPGVIGREVEWPDLLSIEFDLSWNGPLGFATGLYFTSLNDTEADGYMLMLGDGSVDLMRSRHGNTEQVGAAADVPALSQNDRTHVKIYVNKKTKTISLLLDGAHIRQWTDRSEFKLRGRMLVFSSQSEAQVKVSRIRVAAWSGRVETEEMETAEQGEDVMRLINGDRVSGKLQSIEKNNVLFYTTHGSLGVPMQKIEDVTLAGRVTPYVEKPREVRAFFCGAGRVTMALEKWDARQAIATLAGAGRATFSTAAFQRLEFHARTASRDDGDEFPDSPAVESPR